ncbi:LINE-1 reverse transcriptase isogeny [Gossypium australe]|uniref:LINE-1 reverse transcriptase isogeny n=1 Tax=Gossypium australe TaxID=47621 RepID=A0A5B6WXN1_9ROSI|nr:LINE-1 reverse transcriptase isogeny [Gossypium australe]
MDTQVRNSVMQVLNVRNSINPEKYIGFLNMVGRGKKLAFQILKDRMRQKINSWSFKYLSQWGKEVFIKFVLQAIPTYSMACFLLPKSLC